MSRRSDDGRAAVALALALLVGCTAEAGGVVTSGATTNGDAAPLTLTFSDEATCTRLAAVDACDVVMCDLIPEGSTFEETCGRWFQEGITFTGDGSPAGQATILAIGDGVLVRCEVVDVAREPDGLLLMTLADGAVLRFGGPPDLFRDALVTAADTCGG